MVWRFTFVYRARKGNTYLVWTVDPLIPYLKSSIITPWTSWTYEGQNKLNWSSLSYKKLYISLLCRAREVPSGSWGLWLWHAQLWISEPRVYFRRRFILASYVLLKFLSRGQKWKFHWLSISIPIKYKICLENSYRLLLASEFICEMLAINTVQYIIVYPRMYAFSYA